MATILFLHGWHSVPGGVKPTYLKDHAHSAGTETAQAVAFGAIHIRYLRGAF